MDASNVVMGKRKRSPAPKYVDDPDFDELLGNDSTDSEEEEEESSCDDEDGDEDGSGSDEEEEVEEGSASDKEELEDGEDEQGQDMEGDMWRPVPHRFLPEGEPEPGKRVLYEVSNLGIARSLQRDTPRLLKPILHQNGYHRYSLAYGGRMKQVLAHDLVLGTFKGPYPGPTHLWHIDHVDRNKHNNALSNLHYIKAQHSLSWSHEPLVRKGPSTTKPKAWSCVMPDRPDWLQWRQHPEREELEIAKEGHADNLQFISHTVNSCKRTGRNSNNMSGVNGVSWHKDQGKWRAEIPVDGKRRHLGMFVDKSEAKRARLDAEKKYS